MPSPADHSPAQIHLTERERQILVLAADGFTSREISVRLRISPRTVDAHRSHAMKKLGLHNKAQLVRYVVQNLLRSTATDHADVVSPTGSPPQ